MKRLILSIGFLLVLTSLTYGEATTYFFTDVDTFSLINSGRYDSIADIFRVVNSELMAGRMINAIYYRPVTSLAFGTLYHLFGLNPVGYHLFNLTLFFSTACLILFLARTIFKTKRGHWIGLLGASVFILHPLQVDNVPAIARLGDLLATFLAILSVFLFCRFFLANNPKNQSWLLYGLSVLSAFLAVAAKEPGIVATAAIPLAILFFDPEHSPLKRRIVKAARFTIPYAILAMLFVIWRAKIIGGLGGYVSIRGIFADSQYLNFVIQIKTTVIGHFWGLFAPSFSNNFDVISFYLMDRFWLVILIGLGVIAYFSRKLICSLKKALLDQAPSAFDGKVFWFLGSLLLVHAFLLFFTLFSVRYLYLSTALFSTFFALAIFRLAETFQPNKRKVITAVLTGLILLGFFWHCPLWNKERLRRWALGGEIARNLLTDLGQKVQDKPDDNFFLLNVPYVLVYGRTSPVFWEIPFNQILLEHAVEDYLALTHPDDQTFAANVTVASYLFLQDHPNNLNVETKFVDGNTVLIEIVSGAIASPFPWTKIPGRWENEGLFEVEGGREVFEHEPKSGWPKTMQIHFSEKALALPHLRFLEFNGKGLSDISKAPLYGAF